MVRRLLIIMLIILLSSLSFEIGELENFLSEGGREKPLILRREEPTQKSKRSIFDRIKGTSSLFP